MMDRLLAFLIALGLIVLSALLFVKNDEEFHILYKPKSYSYSIKGLNDQFDISFFASSDDSFYLEKSSLVRASVVNQDTREEVALLVQDIVLGEEVNFKGQTYHYVSLVCEMSVESTGLELTYEDASIHMVYENQDVLKIPIGEFYVAYQSSDNNLRIQELIATHDTYQDITVSGLYVSLSHTLQSNIHIDDISLGSHVADINPEFVQVREDAVDYTDKVTDILDVMTYDHIGERQGNISYYVPPRNSLNLYLPLVYQSEPYPLHQFYIKIGYYVDGVYIEEIIDDFPYIKQNTTIIKEEEYIVYVPETHDH